jgi:inorganic pyrophosphatase
LKKKLFLPRPDVTQQDLFNMVVLAPRWSNAKMKVNMEERLNPICHQLKNGKVQFVPNYFPFHGYLCNQGFIPQTLDYLDPVVRKSGEQIPVEVFEIGSTIHALGSVIEVKILGALVVTSTQSKTTSWKILAVHKDDPLAKEINFDDSTSPFFSMLEPIQKWLKLYTDNSSNEFQKEKLALYTLHKMHSRWRNTAKYQIDGTTDHVKRVLTESEAIAIIDNLAAPCPDGHLPAELSTWTFNDES